MNRRGLLAAIGAAVTAGCSTDSDREYTPVTRGTTDAATPTATTAETEQLPSPPGDPTASSARSFVATYEERGVHNDLVEQGYARSVEVETATVEVFRETEAGYFLLSSCSGSAESGSDSGSMGRNAHSIVHFVASETHKRVPYNWYQCAEFRDATTDESDDSDPAKFQIYDFQSEIDYDQPESGGRWVDVRVERESGETVFDRTYETSLPLTVQPGVVARPDRYVFTATLDDGTRVERNWNLSTPSTPPWWALAVFVAPDGDLFTQVVDLPGDLGLPEGSLCRR